MFSFICCVLGVACLVGGFPLLHNRSQPYAAGSPAVPAGTDVTPQLVLEAGGHQALIRTLLFTANGQELVSVSGDKTIRVWSVSPDGRRTTLARTMRGQMEEGRPGMLATVALSPPTRRASSACSQLGAPWLDSQPASGRPPT